MNPLRELQTEIEKQVTAGIRVDTQQDKIIVRDSHDGYVAFSFEPNEGSLMVVRVNVRSAKPSSPAVGRYAWTGTEWLRAGMSVTLANLVRKSIEDLE